MESEQKLPRELIRIERRLEDVLQPITPPAAFVRELQGRLDQEMVKKHKTRKVKNNLLIAGGVLGAAALLITVIRALTSWEKIAASIAKYLPRMGKREQAASI